MGYLLNNRSYQVLIDGANVVNLGGKSRTVITGWAVDKMRSKALPIKTDVAQIKIARVPHPAVNSIFGLKV